MARHHEDDASTLAVPYFDPTPEPTGRFVLTVVEGPDTGRQFPLDSSQPSRVLVGQGPACNVRLTDREVSRRHLAIEFVGRRLRVSDQRSKNGTFVDGVAIVEAFLLGGELLRLGRTALSVEYHSEGGGAPLPAMTRFGRTIGASTEMRRVYPFCQRLAEVDIPAIIEGETGTGKEVLAESIHELGKRAEGPFVVFDCTAAPSELVESELFGHDRGAFTGAINTRRGVFERAHGGTLLIDEIGDFDLALQPKLLRAIERSEIRRVGSETPIRVDVRLLAATRRNLDQEVQAGRFRDDLFHRLAVARVELPPLRKRAGDIPLLVEHFLKAFGGRRKVPKTVLMRWLDYEWPGNIRELKNAVARFLAFGELDSEPRAPQAAHPQAGLLESVIEQNLHFTEAKQRVLEEFERLYVEHALDQHEGNVMRAAEASGIARRYFHIIKARVKATD
jgi:DNA-binding NtrC family response regulator